MSRKILKVAIVGAGMIANAGHIPAWKHLEDDIEIVGVCNRHLARAEHTAKRHHIPRAYNDWEAMLAQLKPDIVSVCTPNAAHRELAIAALKAGAHVLCEKPVATGYAEALEMYEASKAADRILTVAQTGRFSNATIAAREIAASGHLGKMVYAETSAMRRRGIPTWGTFHIKEASGGGPIFDLGVHVLDALLWIVGNPQVVAVSGISSTKLADSSKQLVTTLEAAGAPTGVHDPRPYDSREFDVEEMAAAFIRLENGAAVILRTSWVANIPPEGIWDTLILGTKAGLRLDPLTIYGSIGRYQADTTPVVPPDSQIPFQGHWGATENLVKAIRGEEELVVKRAEVLNVIRALEALYHSAREGREVWLDD